MSLYIVMFACFPYCHGHMFNPSKVSLHYTYSTCIFSVTFCCLASAIEAKSKSSEPNSEGSTTPASSQQLSRQLSQSDVREARNILCFTWLRLYCLQWVHFLYILFAHDTYMYSVYMCTYTLLMSLSLSLSLSLSPSFLLSMLSHLPIPFQVCAWFYSSE